MISEHPRGEDGAAAGGPRPVNAAIVLEPTGALHAMIADAKSWVRRELGDRVYLGEPPHSTLFAGTFDDVGTLGPLLEAVCSDAPPVTIRTIGMMTFPKDVRAGGGDTVVLKAEPTKPLFDLQRRVADALRHRARIDTLEAEAMADPRWRASTARYGWPFVGDHWVPHLTIAALDATKDVKAIHALMARPAVFESTVRGVSLWDVVDTHARPRATFALRGGAK